MMNRGVFGRQMFRYGGHVKMQDGGSVPQGPMPTDQGQMLDPEMAALAEGAMERGVDPQMVQDELAGYAGQFEQMDQAEDYESAINAIRGDDLPIQDRYAELAELVGPEDAQSTPESVLTLVQPVIQMAEIDQGIGGLAAGQMEDVAVEGPMSQGIMSTVNLGADEEAAPPANFNQGGVVPPVQYYGNGGAPGANPTDQNQKLNEFFLTPLRQPGFGAPSKQQAPASLLADPAKADFLDRYDNPNKYKDVVQHQELGSYLPSSTHNKDIIGLSLAKTPPSSVVYPIQEETVKEEEKKVEEKAKKVEEKAKKVEAKEADLEANQKKNLETAGEIIKGATKESGDEELKKYMKRYEDILMDDESIKKNLKENKDMAKAQMLFGLAEGFFKFGSTPRKGGQSSLGVLMQSMAPAIQNASQQVAVLQAQKQKIEDRQMQIKLAALKSFDQKELAMAQAKAKGRMSISDILAMEKRAEEKTVKQKKLGAIDKRLNQDFSDGFAKKSSIEVDAFAKSGADLKKKYGKVTDAVGKMFENFRFAFFPDQKTTEMIKGYHSDLGKNEDQRTAFDNALDNSYAQSRNLISKVQSRLNEVYKSIYIRGGKSQQGQKGFEEFSGDDYKLDKGSSEEILTKVRNLHMFLKTDHERTKEILRTEKDFIDQKDSQNKVRNQLNHLDLLETSLGDLEILDSLLRPVVQLRPSTKSLELQQHLKNKKLGGR